MAGIYIHVPYCKTRCIYCDFFTQTNSSTQSQYVEAIEKEILIRKEYIDGEPIQTIYFGGGTPSQLSISEFQYIFEAIKRNFTIVENAEITLEANPDDLTIEYLNGLRTLPFNRLSMGVQSFNNEELKFLNRRHDAQKAIDAVRNAQGVGFNNISIDLMYGLPNQSMEIWTKNLETAISLNIQHISSYHLIYEEKTKLYRLLQQKKVKQVDEDLSLDMFSVMIEELSKSGFEHYEISNFAQKDLYSKHNTSYWLGEKYLGLGPSAHSYDSINRAWNISSISKYIAGVEQGIPSIETENLTKQEQYNDYILTGMRTKWGVDMNKMKTLFGQNMLDYCMENIRPHLKKKTAIQEGDVLKLTKDGIFVSDGIMSDLMYID